MICKLKSTNLNGSKYVSLTIQLNISHFFTQLNGQAIQFSISDLFALSVNVKQCYLTHR